MRDRLHGRMPFNSNAQDLTVTVFALWSAGMGVIVENWACVTLTQLCSGIMLKWLHFTEAALSAQV